MNPSAVHGRTPSKGERVGVSTVGTVVAMVVGRDVYVGGSEIVGVTEGAGTDGVGSVSRTLSRYPVAYWYITP